MVALDLKRGASISSILGTPLTPADTSSPRATFKDFIETTNQGHALLVEIVRSYLGSSRLYLSAEERMEVDRILVKLEIAKRTLNLSELPAALAQSLSVYRVLQLKEVLDRLELPAYELVPDAAAMQSASPLSALPSSTPSDGPSTKILGSQGGMISPPCKHFSPSRVARSPSMYTPLTPVTMTSIGPLH